MRCFGPGRLRRKSEHSTAFPDFLDFLKTVHKAMLFHYMHENEYYMLILMPNGCSVSLASSVKVKHIRDPLFELSTCFTAREGAHVQEGTGFNNIFIKYFTKLVRFYIVF